MSRTTLILIALFAVVSCKKAANNYDFSWKKLPQTSSIYAYRFEFAMSPSTVNLVVWDFGDGTRGSGPAPTHAYYAVGIYTVRLIVNGDSAHQVKKVLDINRFIPHTFSEAGAIVVDSGIVFHSNVTPDSTFQWDFGDGSLSTDSVPTHVFHSVGSYNVKLTINGHPSTSVTESIIVNNDPIYTYLIGGTRLWHHTTYLSTSTPPNPKVSIEPDTSFALTYINATRIAWGSRYLDYSAAYSNDSMLDFEYSYVDNTLNSHSGSVQFFHNSNRIAIYTADRIGAGSSETDEWVTP